MLTIWIDCAWIVVDLVFCLYVEIELHPLTPVEWILGGAGLMFALGVLLATFFDLRQEDRKEARAREAHLVETGKLMERLATAEAKVETRLDIVTQLGVESVHKLQALTHTTREPVVTSILAATSQIETLQQQVSDLQQRQRRTLSVKQRHTLRDAVSVIKEHSPEFNFSIYYNWLDEEAQQYSLQFAQILLNLGACAVPSGTQQINDQIEGVVIRIKNHNAPVPVPPQATRLSEALTKANIPHSFADRFPTNPTAPIRDDYFDLVIGRKSEDG